MQVFDILGLVEMMFIKETCSFQTIGRSLVSQYHTQMHLLLSRSLHAQHHI